MEVLREITEWTSAAYKQNQLLSGIIYLHPITHAPMEGSAMRNVRMFQSLCGQQVLGNVFLTTTQWSKVDRIEGEVREDSLRNEDFWGGLIAKGATLQRFHGTKESGLELIRKLRPNIPKPLDVQVQMVRQNMTLLETNVGGCANEELIAQAKKHEEEVESLERERREAMRARDHGEEERLERLHAAKPRYQEGREGKRDRGIIAVATKDIMVTGHITALFTTYATKGRMIFDINNHKEFESEPFRVDIHYTVNLSSGFQVYTKPLRELFDAEMGDTNHIILDGIRYQCQSGPPIKRGNQEFVIFAEANLG